MSGIDNATLLIKLKKLYTFLFEDLNFFGKPLKELGRDELEVGRDMLHELIDEVEENNPKLKGGGK